VSDVTEALADWLIDQALHELPLNDILYELGMRMNSAGFPVWRWSMAHPVLDPTTFGVSRVWQRDVGVRDVLTAPVGFREDERWTGSAYAHLADNDLARYEERLTGTSRFALLEQLFAEGATGYLGWRVPLPMRITRSRHGDTEVGLDGLVGSWTTDAPGGWTPAQAQQIELLHRPIALATKMAVHRDNTERVMHAYLGRDAGDRVLRGAIQRGDVASIQAVIWFSDLRGSTPLAERLEPRAFLELLNAHFECTAGAVEEYGGQVLRFIGDAALAIFPIGENSEDIVDGCRRAFMAALEAKRRSERLNERREADGQSPVGYGIGLHEGEVLYGNIGTRTRVEFSVVGAAANTAARVESLARDLGVHIVLTERVARHLDADLRSCGRHHLRGVDAPIEVFTLADS
jgi:adenylate cyclase